MNEQTETSKYQYILEQVKQRIPIKLTFRDSFLYVCCRFVRKHKGQRSIQKLIDFQTGQLDVRRVIANSISLRDFFHCFLTPQQKALIANQRSRVASIAGKQEAKSSSDDNDPISVYKKANYFMQETCSFVPSNSFEHRLVKGLLFRPENVKKRLKLK